VVAVGHLGNFELYAHAGLFVPGFRMATTYRALRQPTLDRLFQAVRAQSGCLYFERRAGVVALREAMQRERLMIGFLADQHAGVHGARLPFLGRECSTNVAAAVFALRYHCPLHTAICYRLGLGRWRIEVGDEIPTRERGRPRRVEAIALDINRAFEAAIRREPANWFWVHNRWKSKGRAPRAEGQKPGVESLPAAGSEGAKTRQTR
jgi:KDO2-lipid IV(A) lauroyltransferase